MKLTKLALVLAGVGFAAHAGAETDEVLLFNEGDQPYALTADMAADTVGTKVYRDI